jgi:ubiquinone/menaquinone biosynthesis C-methylase UbiE
MFSDPIKNVEQFGFKLGQSVADLGSGSGHYTMAVAKAVGDKGMVYAVDIQKDMLGKLKNDAGKLGLFNVEVVWGDVEKPGGAKLKDGAVDAAILSNLLFQVGDKEAVAKECFRILKPLGKLLVIDWADSFGGLGPTMETVVSHDLTVALFTGLGFVLDREIKAGDHHYGIIFTRP